MKPKSTRQFLALVTSITAFAAGNAFATQYTWLGTTNTDWATSSNWNSNGVAQTNGTFVHRLSVSNTPANSSKPATYNFPGVTTTYLGDSASGGRGLVIGSAGANAGVNSTMLISGGTFSTLGGLGADIIGNGNTNAGTLTIDGTASSGDAQFIGIDKGISFGLGFGSFATLNIKNGSATLFDLTTNNTTATINLETGGTLTMNRLAYAGGGNNIININGGTLKSRTASATFIATPTNGNTIINVKAAGAIIDAGHNITIARPLLEDATSLGGGITKNGTATLTLGGVSTTTGPAVINAGGLIIPAGVASWPPSSFSHSGSILGFNIGVYNPANLAPISTGNLSFNAPISVNVSGSQFVVGQIPLINYSGTITGFENLTLNTASLPPGVVATLENDDAGLVFLDVTQGGFVWSGDSTTPGTGDWDASSLNWNNFTASYSDPSPVTFSTIIGGGTINLTSNVSPATVEFTNILANDYVLEGTGKITGASAVNKTGSGTVILTNTNDYSGNTTVTNGILTISSTDALPGWNANSRYPISSGATLAVQNTVTDASINTILGTTGNFAAGANLGFDLSEGDRTFPSDITGSVGITLLGFNALTLSGSNSYTGTTRVIYGTLKPGSSSAFTGTGPLQLNNDGVFDLNGFNATFNSLSASTSSNTITNSGEGTGTDTLTITGGTTSFTGLIEDGPTRKTAVKCSANNASNVPNSANNTYSGGLTLMGAIAPATNGLRIIPVAATATLDEAGNILSGPYGTGTLTIGESATDKVQVYLQAANRMIDNDIVVNSATGTDTVAAFRVESTGHVINGDIQANLASVVFRNNVTNGSAGIGALTLTGTISTGAEPTAGLSVIAAGANSLTLTLLNESETANSYTGNTTINGGNAILILGAANQIPSGTGTGNVVMTASKLDLAGFDETINGLSGSGTVDNFFTGTTNTLTLGDGDATGTTFSGSLNNTNGELSLVKVGNGTQTLSGTSFYTGSTTVKAGTLNLTGLIDSPTVTVGGATASGTPTLTGANGTINGTLLIAAANGGAEGTINPGLAGNTGTLNLSETTIAGTYACDLISDASDLLSVNGDLNITGAKIALTSVTPTPGTYVIATYSGTLTGTFTPTESLPAGTSLDYATTGEIKLVIAPSSGYSTWATSNNVTEGEAGDDDKDGISNLVEYALGLDPQVGDPAPGSLTGNLLSFSKGADAVLAADVAYSIETSSTLTAESWTPVIPDANNDSIISFTLPATPGGKLFGRLKVVK